MRRHADPAAAGPSPAPTRFPADPEGTVHRAFAASFVEAQYAWTSMLLDHLALSRQRVGDLDSTLILGVIGLSTLSAFRRDPKAANPGQAGGRINAQSLAEITGIPRETVRRKLLALAGRGLVAQQPGGAWGLVMDANGDSRARAELEEVTQSAIASLGRLFARLTAIAEGQEEGSAPPSPP